MAKVYPIANDPQLLEEWKLSLAEIRKALEHAERIEAPSAADMVHLVERLRQPESVLLNNASFLTGEGYS